MNYYNLNEIVETFIESVSTNTCDSGMGLESDLRIFLEFLIMEKGLNNLEQIDSILLLEFISHWLVKKFALEKDTTIKEMFNSLALFFQWLNDAHQINLKTDYLAVYNRCKISTRRVIRALNEFYSNIDIFKKLIEKSNRINETKHGWYEIESIERRNSPFINLIHLLSDEKLPYIAINYRTITYLEKGDVMHLTLLSNKNIWEIVEIDNIFPPSAKPFIKF